MQTMLLKVALSLLQNRPKSILHYLKKHFGADPLRFPVVEAEFTKYRHADVCVALQQYITGNHRRGVMLGVSTTDCDSKLSDLIHPDSHHQQTEGPVQFTNVVLSSGKNMSCAEKALYLVRDNGARFAVFLRQSRYEDHIVVEVMSRKREVAEAFLGEIQKMANEHSIYKGTVISVTEKSGDPVVTFQPVPTITRDKLILPEDVIEQIERHTSRFSKHRDLLLSRGRHLKRGLLLYGPPGTGKSLTIMYLLSSMPGRTTLLLNGSNVKLLDDACALARSLQPATLVIDDVDLVAEERTRRRSNSILFELLNQMDGVANDADVLFLLTTNRPEILEPAIASRPGRIDHAILIPLPDTDCRRRLFDLYGQGLPMDVIDVERFVRATDGVSAAFIRELFRKTALLAIEEGASVLVQDRHIAEALESLQKNSLTSKFLGYVPEPLDPRVEECLETYLN